MLTYMTAWLRYYHPREFITAYLNNATNEDDIVAGTKLAKVYGIKIEKPVFGESLGNYSIADNGSIIKGIGSVLYVSNNCAEGLFNLAKSTKGCSFPEIALQIFDNKIADTRQLGVLAKLDFFREFGSSKTIFEFLDRVKQYNGKKQVNKDKVPKGTERIILNCIKEGIDGFSETNKMYKYDYKVLLTRMFEAMPQVDYSKKDKIIHQLSYLGYIQDKEMVTGLSIGTVVTNKTRYDSYKIDFINGSSGWLKFKDYLDQPKKGQMILITSEMNELRNNGRSKDRVVVDYEVIELDRNTQANKK